MNAILERLLAVSKEIGPPPKRYAIVASTVKGKQKMSDYDKFAQLPPESIGLRSVTPVIPHPFRLTKTVTKTKKFRRLNRPPKIKVKDVQVPAVIVMDMSIFDPPKFTAPVFTEKIRSPKICDYDRYGIY